ncbi:MAG: MarR family winged helix-turn-helix transcriptional regulator [Phyllobacterium sp.]
MKNTILAARADFLTELTTAGRKLRTMFDARVKERGLTLARARALLFLSRNPCMTQTELASALEIETPTLVRLLDGLEKQGLVERNAVDGDRRAKHITLTEAAQSQVRGIDEVTNQLREQVLRDIDEEQLLAGIRVLRLLQKNIEAMNEGAAS